MVYREIEVPIFLPPPPAPRSAGIHVSNIIRCIAAENGYLKPEWVEELSLVDVRTITDTTAILRISLGLAWEDWYIPRILGKYNVVDHPGEMKYDDVYMTHDGEDLSVTVTEVNFAVGQDGSYIPQYIVIPRVHEVKCTYKSTRTTARLEEQFMWMSQIKGYCIGRGTRFAVLHIMHVCGNYKYPISPMHKVYEIEFTQDELDSNWRMLREYKNLWLAREEQQRLQERWLQ